MYIICIIKSLKSKKRFVAYTLNIVIDKYIQNPIIYIHL